MTFPILSTPGARLGGLAALLLAAASLCPAQTLSFSTPLGTFTVFESGPRATVLQSSATLQDVVSAETLSYLDAPSSPATSRSEALKGGSSFTSTVQLAINESQTTGLPFTTGDVGFMSSGSGGSGFGTITLYFLISVPHAVVIDFTDIRSTVTTTGSPADSFALRLFESDAGGAKIGNALLAFSGNLSGASGQYQSSSPFYLVQMDVAGNANASFADAVHFEYSIDLQPITAVPEPGSGILLGVALLSLVIFRSLRSVRGAA